MLREYFRESVSEDPSITMEQILNTLENKFTKLYLEFMSYTLGLLIDFNCLFKSEKLLHNVKLETEKLLKTLCSNYLDLRYIKSEYIFTSNHQNPNHFVNLEKIYLGVAATETFEMLTSENILKAHLDKFLRSCLDFYIELVSIIKKKFEFNCLILYTL